MGVESIHTAPVLNAVRVWILLSTLLVASGWILSALHALNPIGYGICFLIASGAFAFGLRKTKWRPGRNFRQLCQKFARRFKRPAPLIFFVLALLALLGGILYPPANPDSTSYRIPRVMHWLAAGQWHWIATMDQRMNAIGSGYEWLIAPLILLTRTDRLLFLPNFISFLFLPGLIFGVFIRLGVARRVAWWWMWLLPSGWCFIMQAGSTVNDGFAAVYALAAVDLALRSRENKRTCDLWLAMLATALVTGVKQTEIPLAVPGLIAILANIRPLVNRWCSSLFVTLTCALVSALPTLVLNWKKTGSLSGITAGAWSNLELHSPFWGIVGNIFSLTVQNLKPPFFPFSNSWNAAMKHFLQTPMGSHFKNFESFGRLSFGISEQSAALGAGICLLIVVSLFAAWRYRQSARTSFSISAAKDPLAAVLRWVPWLLLLPFMAKIGTFENGRQLAPYYILLLPSILAFRGQSILVRQGWWKAFALTIMLATLGLLVTLRDRPLFPSQVISRIAATHPQSKSLSIISRTYAGSAACWNQRSFLRQTLPPDAKVVGYAATGDGLLELYLWLPYGTRRVVEILPENTSDQLPDIHYVVLEKARLDMMNETLSDWLRRYDGEVVKQWQFAGDPYSPPQLIYLVSLKNS